MTAEALLARLDGAKRTGTGWLARCSSHDDRHASLSIRELDDGRVLVHCFGGCSVHEVVEAVGLELSDLYPPRPLTDRGIKGERYPYVPVDVLRALAPEVIHIVLQGAAIGRGEALSPEGQQGTLVAARRLLSALDAAVPAKDRRAAYRHAMRVAEEDLAEIDA